MSHQLTNFFSTPVYNTHLDIDVEPHIEQVYKEEKKSAGRKLSNTGWQSDNINPKELFDKIGPHVIKYYKEFNCPVGIHLANCWFNINRYKDINTSHHHLPSIISGVFYLKTPKDSGDIVFENPNPYIGSTWSWVWSQAKLNPQEMANEYTSESIFVKSEEKLLLLFPSYLKHSVSTNISKEDRISMSFNIALTLNEKPTNV